MFVWGGGRGGTETTTPVVLRSTRYVIGLLIGRRGKKGGGAGGERGVFESDGEEEVGLGRGVAEYS